MVHKIKGWARDFADHGTGYELGNGGGWAEFSEDGKEEFGDVPCTLITTHERVFTESEVRAVLEEVLRKESDGDVAPGWHVKSGDIYAAFKKHGITLDPA